MREYCSCVRGLIEASSSTLSSFCGSLRCCAGPARRNGRDGVAAPVVDLGGGQLAVATVIRSNGDVQGLEFEQSLIEDGSGGLCTRNRVSPYALAAAGTPLAPLAPGHFHGMTQGGAVPKFGYAVPPRPDAG